MLRVSKELLLLTLKKAWPGLHDKSSVVPNLQSKETCAYNVKLRDQVSNLLVWFGEHVIVICNVIDGAIAFLIRVTERASHLDGTSLIRRQLIHPMLNLKGQIVEGG